MKTTALTELHRALGAKMVEFAGYEMPLQYHGLKEEHHNIRENVGVFDVSHMGEFIVKGPEALDLVQWVTSNDASKLAVGQVQYSCFPNADGGIVDDLLVYRLSQDMCAEGEQAFMLVVNASNIDKDLAWITAQNRFDCRIIDISDETSLLAVQGPRAVQALQSLTEVNLKGIPYYHFEKGTFAGLDNVIISATGYTGAGGFEIYVRNEDALAVWNAIFAAGEPFEIRPAGLACRDTLRLEMGFCLYGNDISDTTSPIEAGLGWITKADKGAFMNSDHFAQQRTEGVSRKLVGFALDERRVPRHDYPIEDANGNLIGVVTSGTHSPSLEIPLGMGYVETAFSKRDTEIFVVAGGKRLKGRVVKMPFYTVG
jgi:aminomethyltransferase